MGSICNKCCPGRTAARELELLADESRDALVDDDGAGSFVSVGSYDGNFCMSFTSAVTGIIQPNDERLPEGLSFTDTAGATRRRISEAIVTTCLKGTTASKQAIESGVQDKVAPWRNLCSPNVADCWIRTVRKPTAAATTILNLKSVNQVPKLVPLETDAQASTVKGALFLMADLDTWPEWFPMCQSCTTLERWGPNEQLCRIEFKIPVVGLRIESIMYVHLVDKLLEEGYLDFQAASYGGAIAKECIGEGGEKQDSAAGEECDMFLGAQVPKGRRFTSRAEVDGLSLRLYPTGAGTQEYRLFMQSEEKCPVDTVTNQVWKTLSRNLMKIIVAQVAKRAPLKVSPERLEYYTTLERRINAAAERHELRSESA